MVSYPEQVDLRAENIDKLIKAIALQEYRMKQVCSINTSSSFIETYYREDNVELVGATGEAIRGVPRLAEFPYAEPNWTKVQSYIEKYAFSSTISYEDELLANIDVISRSLLRVGRAVANAVDQQIFAVLNDGAGNTVTVAVGSEWNSGTVANRDPIQNVLHAKRLLYEDNYDPDGNETYLILNPKDYSSILGNAKVISNPTFKASDVVSNGVVGKICGLKLLVSNVVSVSGALVVIAKEGITWKQAVPLTVVTEEKKGISKTVKAYEMGVPQLTAPNTVVKIKNTDSGAA